MDDRELLDAFVNSRSQAAFRELVDRHLPVVYSAARRLVRDAHLAEEVAQSVFTTLAQKADSIRPPRCSGAGFTTPRVISRCTPSAPNSGGANASKPLSPCKPSIKFPTHPA
jgi:hypothetical protein